jgi:NAD(P)-dependent dehydrogenase (short-subunit alcohol dehydrogenase family)
MDVKGVGAIVTGGASGLGGATAEMLAAAGAKVSIFDLNEAAGLAQAAAIGARFVKVNVAVEAEVAGAVADAEAHNGVARVLVNCAGIAPGAKTVGRENAPHPLDLFRKTIEVNLIGSFAMIAQVAARMAAAEPIGEERGVIVNTASVAAYEGQIGQAAYAASKGGVAGLTLPVARDLAPLNIRCMTIAPGLFMTPMMETLPLDVREGLAAQVPHPRRLGKPEEYAQMAAAIIANPMLNGEVIRLDGALRMPPR